MTDQQQRPCQAQLNWDKQGLPISSRFNDFYFSKVDGLQESQYVFLEHNQLPQRWQHLESDQHFCVAETGFGTGLNFLACWHSWRQQPPTNGRLHFVSVERYPLSRGDLQRALALWPQLQPLSQGLIDTYPPVCSGTHRLEFDQGRVQLTLIFDDAVQAYSQFDGRVDAWFLDGFAPAKNPQMWSSELFQAIARCSQPTTTFSTFTAASIVRRGLQAVGFEVHRSNGFGRKREMIYGQLIDSSTKPFSPPWFARPQPHRSNQPVAIIGAGLAGASTAFALAQRGYHVSVYERGPEPGCGASGNPQGVLYLKLPAQPTLNSQIQLSGYLFSLRLFKQLLERGCDWDDCGVLQLAVTEPESDKHNKLIAADHYSVELVTAVDSQQASEQAGRRLTKGGLFYPLGGWVSPAKLCRRLLDHPLIECHFNQPIDSLEHDGQQWQLQGPGQQTVTRTETVVLANAQQAQQLAPWAELPLKPIRGQTSRLTAPTDSQLNCVLCGTGYIAPTLDQQFCFGASFDQHDLSDEVREADHQHNLEQVAKLCPELADQLASQLNKAQGRVGFRCASPDYLPLVGAVADPQAYSSNYAALRRNAKAEITTPPNHYPGLYLNLAHGSKGLTTAPLSGALLADLIANNPLPLPKSLTNALNPARFIIKKLIKGAI